MSGDYPEIRYNIETDSYVKYDSASGSWLDAEKPKWTADNINSPPRYLGGTLYEPIKVIEAWGLGFCLGNTVKYIARRPDEFKVPDRIEDLKKARWYLDREISRLGAKAPMPAGFEPGAKP